MHELAITQTMLDIVLEKAEESGARRVGAINLVIGELSGFVEESVRFYFDFLAKGTIAEGAALKFTTVSPQARCRNCGKPFELVMKISEYSPRKKYKCKKCGSTRVKRQVSSFQTVTSRKS